MRLKRKTVGGRGGGHALRGGVQQEAVVAKMKVFSLPPYTYIYVYNDLSIPGLNFTVNLVVVSLTFVLSISLFLLL